MTIYTLYHVYTTEDEMGYKKENMFKVASFIDLDEAESMANFLNNNPKLENTEWYEVHRETK